MTLSKKLQYERLNHYTDQKWELEVEKIENEILKYKICCILFWDFYNEYNKKSVYLKETSRLYKPSVHDKFITQEEVYQALLKIGYPMLIAKRRSVFPKINSYYR